MLTYLQILSTFPISAAHALVVKWWNKAFRTFLQLDTREESSVNGEGPIGTVAIIFVASDNE